MKTTFTQTVYRRILIAAVLWLTLTAFISCSAVKDISNNEDKKGKSKNAKSESKKSTKTAKSSRSVKIYPDLVKRVMHVKNLDENQIDFFVFDSAGAIVLHYKMSDGEHKKIIDLKQGSYVYQVFEGDEMTESGKLVFK